MKIQLHSSIGKWTAIWDRQKRKTGLSKWDGGSTFLVGGHLGIQGICF